MSMLNIRNVLVSGLLVVLGASAARAEIQVTEWHLATQARDTFPDPFVSVEENTVSFPYNEVHTATDGPTWAQTAYDFTLDEHAGYFGFLFGYGRSASDSTAESGGRIEFTLTEPLDYNVEGWFALSGTQRILLDVAVTDLSGYGGDWVYRGSHESDATPDESFILGVPGGDVVSGEIGDLSGTLFPDTPYRLTWFYMIENYPGGIEPATAEGALTFTLTPEPSSLALLAVGALGLGRRGAVE